MLGVDLPFDRGKHDGGYSMKGDGIRAEGEFFVLFDKCSRKQLKKRVLENCIVFLI